MRLVRFSTVSKTTLDLAKASLTLYGFSTTKKVEISGSLGLVAYNSSGSVGEVTGDGLYGNYPGRLIYPSSFGVNARATVVGLGYGNQEGGFDLYSDDRSVRDFIAGVAGVASNDNGNPCDTWGGYFVRAKIRGLYVKALQVSSTTSIGKDDDVIACYNKTDSINVSLPSNPSCGKEIKIIQVNTPAVNVTCPDGAKIHYAGNLGNAVSSLEVGGLGYVMFLFWDGQYWHATRTAALTQSQTN